METPAKFIVGEEVMVVSKTMPQHNTGKTEVVHSQYICSGLKTNHSYRGWVYKTAHQPDMSKIWMEDSLKKIPPNTLTSWENCVWQPSDIKVS